jgi:hypothetical protein
MTPTQSPAELERPRADLKRRFVFLSASFPSKEQSTPDFLTADAAEISQAIVAVARAVLSSKGRLVFGGHPTVTPLVLAVAQEYLPENRTERREIHDRQELPVVVYQSEIFTPFVPESIRNLLQWNLGAIRETKKAQNETPGFTRTGKLIPGTATKSLEIMRIKMIKETKPFAAFFIGGMQGIRDEANICRELDPRCQLFYLGAPGGAARRLAEENLNALQGPFQEFSHDMLNSRSYPALVQNLIRLLSSEYLPDK